MEDFNKPAEKCSWLWIISTLGIIESDVIYLSVKVDESWQLFASEQLSA